ncbi:MAG: CDP-alcohol phosphatidyltransferase family protein [Myxococcota bacterium]
MSEPDASPRRVARWRYVVPNAITCIGLLIGLTAAFRAMEGQYVESGWLIALCVLIDKLDGTAARLLGSSSAIGVQLDSLADFVTFGVTPGTLVFMAMLRDDAHFDMWDGTAAGWGMRALVAVYVLAACIRLAKFNVLTEETGGTQVFYGMPTTFAGAIVALSFILGYKYDLQAALEYAPYAAAVLGLLMVSNLPLPKIGPRESKAVNAFQIANVAAGYVCGIFRIFPEYLFALIVGYGLGGFVYGWLRREKLHPQRLDPYPQD